MAFRGVLVAVVCGLLISAGAAETRPTVEDPSYQPSTGAVRVTPTPGEVGLSNRSIESSVNLQPTENKRANASAPKIAIRVEPAPAPVETTTYPTALDPRTGTVRRIKYVLDGKNVFEGDPEPAPVASAPYSDRQPVVVESTSPSTVAPVLPAGHVRNILSDPISGTTSGTAPVAPARLVTGDDLTADKPGTVAAAEDKPLFDDIKGEEHVSARARKCYAVLHEMKESMESINRLLDNRGKENARLLNTTEKLINTISDMSDIWSRDEFREACATAKRSALLFNEELNRAPWRWNYIRWSYTALLRDVRPLREISKTMAEAEPKPQMVVGKDGKATYIDVDPLIDAATAERDQKKRLEVEELAKLRAANASGATRRKEADDKFRRNLDEK